MYKNSYFDRILHDVSNFLIASNQNYHQATNCTTQSLNPCRVLFTVQVFHTGSLAYQTSYLRGTGSYLWGLKSPERETDHLILQQKLRMSRATSPSTLCTSLHGVSRNYFNCTLIMELSWNLNSTPSCPFRTDSQVPIARHFSRTPSYTSR